MARTALAAGAVILADLVLGRVLLRADEARVYFVGRPVDLVCTFRAATGLPCPTCGLTRSVVMSLHGEFSRAWNMAPAGPVVVAGAAAFGIAMLALAFAQCLGQDDWMASARTWLRKTALAYAAGAVIVWLGGWAVSFQAALAAR